MYGVYTVRLVVGELWERVGHGFVDMLIRELEMSPCLKNGVVKQILE